MAANRLGHGQASGLESNRTQTSRIQAPKISAQRKLGEISDSESNARSFLPQPNALKHKLVTDPNDPPAKRKPIIAPPIEQSRPRSASISSNSGRPRVAAARPKISSLRAPPVSGHTRPNPAQTFNQSLNRSLSRNSVNRPPSATGFYASHSKIQSQYTLDLDNAQCAAYPALYNQSYSNCGYRREGWKENVPFPSDGDRRISDIPDLLSISSLSSPDLCPEVSFDQPEPASTECSIGHPPLDLGDGQEDEFADDTVDTINYLLGKVTVKEGNEADRTASQPLMSHHPYHHHSSRKLSDVPSRIPVYSPEKKATHLPRPETLSRRQSRPPIAPSYDTAQMEEMVKLSETWDAIKAKVISTSDSAMTAQLQALEMQTERIKELLSQISSLNEQNNTLNDRNSTLEADLRDARTSVTTLTMEVETVARRGQMNIEDLEHTHRRHVSDIEDRNRQEMNLLKDQALAEISKMRLDRENIILQAREEIERTKREGNQALEDLKQQTRLQVEETEQKLRAELDTERRALTTKIDELVADREQTSQSAVSQAENMKNRIRELEVKLAETQAALEIEKKTTETLRNRFSEEQAKMAELEAHGRAMKSKIDFLESDSQAQGQAYADMRQRMDEALRIASEAEEKLRQEERVRRKLHNQIQELKGNIRVFCRVRPALEPPPGSTARVAQFSYPDEGEEGRELVVTGPARETLTGMSAPSIHNYSFDKVFPPTASNADVFDEISQLVQSALDGYNVCIFCYGQTGSGKTYTMSQPGDGMIPRAVEQIWEEKERLKSKGWDYQMTGEFVEVYNEQLNDLLGRAEELDRKKLEIRHDPSRGRTTITDATVVPLDSPNKVHDLLATAIRNRSVAATKSNERSSRSHTIFILKIYGANKVTGEVCEGVLNLVDLAGSERVKVSGVEGARLREAQNINRSLSCLGDVISALGNAKSDGKDNFVPYRNSKLTYLLQYSLGGNSKTLMFVMVSPLYDHLAESNTSLKFATKVYNTHIGTAKKHIR